MEFIGLLWDEAIVRPLTNSLLLLYTVAFSNFGLAIILLTIVIRGLTYPFTLRQVRQTQKMQEMQTRVAAIRTKHPNDSKQRSQETMRLYKELGINPLGCLGPFAVQIPVLIGLFIVIRNTLGVTPEGLAGLASDIYGWLPLDRAVPVNRGFLWLDLGEKDPTFVLPVLSGVTMWVQQKMSMVSNSDPQQQSTQRMMLWMMPVFFVAISITFFSGVVLYWVVSNLIGIVMQYFISGWGGLRPGRHAPAAARAAAKPPANEELSSDGKGESGTVGENGGRGNRARPAGVRRQSRRGRGRRS
jgi:YidC/Oxa1 family membrane protein insertase